MAATVVTFVDDIFFLAKIRETAKAVGVNVVSPDKNQSAVSLAGAHTIFLDLGARTFSPIDRIRDLKANANTACIPIVAFVSHVQTDLIAAARTVGCDLVLARSAFTQRLPELLRRLDGD